MQSVLGQDYPNLEYWVIDGASTDGSVRLLDRYSSRLTGWISEKDRGQADAINKGFAQTTGEIIAWLNSDDLYHPGAVSAAVSSFRKHPEASFVFSDVESIDAQGKPYHRMRYGHWGLADLMRFRIIGQPAVFMRRALFERVGGLDEAYHYLLDHKLWLSLAAIAEPRYVPNAIWASARIHQGAKNVSDAGSLPPGQVAGE